MNLSIGLLLICLLGFPATGLAKEVHLQKGEVYQEGELTIICQGEPSGSFRQPLVRQECQHWDDYAKKCLFEKTIYTYNNLECSEECQKWDSYTMTCNYQNKCTFYPDQETFLKSTCSEFDNYSRKCLKVGEEKIGQ